MNAENVLSFWFEEHGPGDWFKKDESFDDLGRVSTAEDFAFLQTPGSSF